MRVIKDVDHKTSNASAISGAVIGLCSYDEEMAAFDQLGPCVRAILDYAPLLVLATPLIMETAQHNLNPRDPATDAMLARNLANNITAMVASERGLHDAQLGMRPLVARRLRRSRR